MKEPDLNLTASIDSAAYRKDLIERVLQNRLDVIEALELQYELALGRLLERHPELDDEDYRKLERRIAQHFLFDYFLGFLGLRFVPAHEGDAAKTARQQKIEQSLRRLAKSVPGRQLMDTYAVAALERRLHRMLRELLNLGKSILKPHRLFLWIGIRIGLVDDWEKLSPHGIDFGLSLFHLLAGSTSGAMSPDEFNALIGYAYRFSRDQDWRRVEEVIRILSQTCLSIEQKGQLLGCIQSLLEESPPESFERNSLAHIEAMGLSPALERIFKMTQAASDRKYREVWGDPPAERADHQRRILARRQEEAVKLLSLATRQSDEALKILSDITVETLVTCRAEAHDNWLNRSSPELIKACLEGLLFASTTYVPAVDMLFKCLPYLGRETLPDDYLKSWREAGSRLDEKPARFLLDTVRGNGPSRRCAEQLLKNIPGLTEEAIDLMINLVGDEQSPAMLSLLAQMGQRLWSQQGGIYQGLQKALLARLKIMLFEPDIPMHSEWMTVFLDFPNHEPLRQILLEAANILEREDDFLLQSRSLEILRTTAQAAAQRPEPNALILAICWLVDPTDWLRDGRSLTTRLREAIVLLKQPSLGRPEDQFAAEKIVQILDAAITQRAEVQIIVAQALRTPAHHPDLALPLLEKLLKMAATEDRYDQKLQLYIAAFESIATLRPLTLRAIRLLQDHLIMPQQPDPYFQDSLAAAVINSEVLALLAHEVEISPEVIDTLVEIVWRHHCVICGRTLSTTVYERSSLKLRLQEWRHRYFHPEYGLPGEYVLFLFALQSLTNVSALSPWQQQLIERLYRTSWPALVKGLCLLILSRQRPLSEETILLLERLLKMSPFREVVWSMIKSLFKGILSGQETSDDKDVFYILLSQNVAVHALTTWLKESYDPNVKKHRPGIEAALRTSVSLTRHLTEAHLSDSIVYGWRATRGLARMMGKELEKPEQQSGPTWLVRPTDLAYQNLLKLWQERALISGETSDQVINERTNISI